MTSRAGAAAIAAPSRSWRQPETGPGALGSNLNTPTLPAAAPAGFESMVKSTVDVPGTTAGQA